MIIIKQGEPDDFWLKKTGTYRRGTRDGVLTASLSCPYCGNVASLSQHTIEPDGTVKPSVVCPKSECDFHFYIKLEGWNPDEDLKEEK